MTPVSATAPTMLTAFADRLADSRRDRHLFFAVLTLAAIVAIGYHFGTFDQAVHIPFLKRLADPSLYPGDAFFDLQRTHYSFFWFPFVPIYRLGWLEPALFAVHALATLLTFAMLWALSRRLFDDPLAALLGCLALAFPHIGFAGFPVIEFSLLNRTFVLPFLLLAIAWYLDRRIWRSFALLGLLLNLHALSVSYVLAMLLLDGVLRRHELGARTLAIGLGLFALAAAPVLLWRLAMPRGISALSLQPEWLGIVSRSMLYNIFHLVGTMPYLWLLTACGVAAFGLYGIARRRIPAGPHDRAVDHFMLAILALVLAAPLVAGVLPMVLLVQLQIVRAGTFALIFGYLYFAAHLARRWRARAAPSRAGGAGRSRLVGAPGWRRRDGWDDLPLMLLTGSFILSTLPFVPLAVYGIERGIPGPRLRVALAGALVATAAVASLVLAIRYEAWSPGIHVYARRTPWVDVQAWARENTPRDALFITPPHLYWLYEPDWRVHAERSTVANLTEVLEMAFDPKYLDHWQPRFEAVAPGALALFQGDVYANRRLAAEAYDRLTDAQLAAVAERLGADYAVVARPRSRGFPAVYQNAGFVVYRLR